MFDLSDLFETSFGSDSARRITQTGDRLHDLERRYERLHLVTVALWQLLKDHTGLTDTDLKRYLEQVDKSDGSADGKLTRVKGSMDCPQCSRRVLKSATVCAWCGTKLKSGDPFHAT